MSAEIKDMTFAEYRTAPGVNLSRLKHMRHSPRKYMVNPEKESSSLSLGRAIHTRILEPDKFWDEYAVWLTRRAGKKFEEFCLLNPGKEILNSSEAETVTSVSDAVDSHAIAHATLNHGVPEQSVFWTHEPTGIECKARLDWVNGETVVDLKSTRDVSKFSFGRDASSYDYFAQLAFYHDAIKSVDGCDRRAMIVAVETSSPFDVVVYEIPESALDLGRRRYEVWLEQVAECMANDYWPGVGDEIQALEPAAWYVSEMEEDASLIVGGVEVRL